MLDGVGRNGAYRGQKIVARMPALAGAGVRVKLIGYDALPEALDAVRSGTLAATVDQRAARQGRMGVEYLLKRLHGEAVPLETLIDVRIVSK